MFSFHFFRCLPVTQTSAKSENFQHEMKSNLSNWLPTISHSSCRHEILIKIDSLRPDGALSNSTKREEKVFRFTIFSKIFSGSTSFNWKLSCYEVEITIGTWAANTIDCLSNSARPFDNGGKCKLKSVLRRRSIFIELFLSLHTCWCFKFFMPNNAAFLCAPQL